MLRRNFLKLMGALAVAPAAPGWARPKSMKPLNFVFILIDDMGWRDCGCNGSTFYETPNIDRLAGEGMRFTDAYAACAVCSPTRAAIMSGKYPARLHLTDWIPGNRKKGKLDRLAFEQQLPLSEVTIAESFKSAGYKTCFVGKWHLGGRDYYPKTQGFDVNVAGNNRGAPRQGYFSPYNLENLTDGPKGEYLPDRLATEAMDFIDSNADDRFFLFLSHYTVHSPVQAKKETIAKYKAKAARLKYDKLIFVKEGPDARNRERQDHATFAAMIEHMDENVGRVLDKIKRSGMEDNTVVIFTSDNGGQSILPYGRTAPWGSNRPLRGGKGWNYEGGIRVPLIVKWPGVTKPGSVCSAPVISCDHYPTLLEIAALPPKPRQHIDGVSLAPLLKQTGSLKRDALYWHYPHYHGSAHRPSGAIRAGDFKLIEFFENMNVELYNLRKDIREDHNLARTMPDKAGELRNKLHRWRQQVNAAMPKPNPDYTGDS
ncbi:MAG: sulfatase [Planctomycetes bacterium]|nr:sulfatase [Planctomycetota bacterium]